VAVVDKKGRLFGKINLLDLAVLLVVLAVVARFGMQYVEKRNAPANAGGETIEVTIKLPNVQQPTVGALPVGTVLRDSQAATRPVLGTIVKAETKPAIVRQVGPDGKLWETESKDVYDLYITLSGTGKVSQTGVMFGDAGGVDVKIGRGQPMISPTWAGQGTIWHINTEPGKQ
jgi:hypothetical protein